MGVPVTAILGLGREVGDAIARRFSETGHSVLAADPSAERLATARNAVPDDVILHHGELFTRLGLRNAFTAAIEGFGRIDNAVIIPELEAPDTLLDFSTEKFDKAIAKSIRGTALALQVFAERIAEQEDLPTVGVERLRQKGTITFVLSYSAIASMPGQFTETISQGGVLGVMRAGAVDGLSIGYHVVKAESDRLSGTRRLIEVDLWEISVVTFPMLPAARVSAVKRGARPTTREFERWLMRDAGFSRMEARTIVHRGFKALEPRDAAAGDQALARAFRAASRLFTH